MNAYDTAILDDFDAYVEHIQEVVIHPLFIKAQTKNGMLVENFAFNEVSILRQEAQAIHLSIAVDGIKQINEFIADGILVATPMGSSAYNLACGGPILPLNTNLCALTPISPYRPKRWQGALIDRKSTIEFTIFENEKRPAYVSTDTEVIHDIVSLSVYDDKKHSASLLFCNQNHLEKRLFQEQFSI